MGLLGMIARRRLRMSGRASFLVLLLAAGACTGGARPSIDSVPPDPPPLPARRPTPPRYVASVATVTLAPRPAQGASEIVTQALPAAPHQAAMASGVYLVQADDSVYRVARRFDVPIRSLIDANRLTPPFALTVGQRLNIVAPRRHRVVAGDTVYGVSRRYGVDLTELVRLNRVAAPYRITTGQSLLLPGSSAAVLAGKRPAAPAPRQAAARPPEASVPALPPRKPAAAPQIASASGSAAVSGPLTASATMAATGDASASRSAAGPPRPAAPLAAIPRPPPLAGGKFLWPVDGRVVLGFGPKTGGLHNDGINIAAPRGAPVLAAENGVVAYSGNQLRGFGNLLLIKHADGWMTAYAHSEQVLVRRGETVKRGQAIARVGSTGGVAHPQLHFEVRKGTRAVDPTRLLARQAAAG